MNKGFKWQHKTSLFPQFLFLYKNWRGTTGLQGSSNDISLHGCCYAEGWYCFQLLQNTLSSVAVTMEGFDQLKSAKQVF